MFNFNENRGRGGGEEEGEFNEVLGPTGGGMWGGPCRLKMGREVL